MNTFTYSDLLEEGEINSTHNDDINNIRDNIINLFNDNILKKKRKRNNKNKNSINNNGISNSYCKIKNIIDTANTGNIIFKEIQHNNVNDDLENNENSIQTMNEPKFNYFIVKVKEVFFKLDQDIFKKGRPTQTNDIEQNIDKSDKLEESSPDNIFLSTFDVPNNNFWLQRYYYFSRFDEGIKLDHESWYSVTPEEISIYIAKLSAGKNIIDAFCGSGGNTIQFSKFCNKVYAVDIDPIKIELCKNNSKVYQCDNNIEFIASDYLRILDNFPNLKSDVVFLSPPWGGMDYKSTSKYSLKQWITPDIKEIIKTSLNLSENLMFYLPRNTDIEELFEIIAEVKSFNPEEDDSTLYAEIQMLKSANKVKAILVCFGKKYNNMSIKEIRKYLIAIYPNIEAYQLCQLINFTKVIGVSRFFELEYNFRKNEKNEKNIKSEKIEKKKNFIYKMIKFIKEEILTDEELEDYNKLDKKNKNEENDKKDGEILKFEGEIINVSELQNIENFEKLIKNII